MQKKATISGCFVKGPLWAPWSREGEWTLVEM